MQHIVTQLNKYSVPQHVSLSVQMGTDLEKQVTYCEAAPESQSRHPVSAGELKLCPVSFISTFDSVSAI